MQERKYELRVIDESGVISVYTGLTIEEYEFLSEKALQNGFEVLA